MGPTNSWKVLSFSAHQAQWGECIHSFCIHSSLPIWKGEKAKCTFLDLLCQYSRWKLGLSLIVHRRDSKGREKRGSFSLSLPAAFCRHVVERNVILPGDRLSIPFSSCLRCECLQHFSDRGGPSVLTFWSLVGSYGVCDFNS